MKIKIIGSGSIGNHYANAYVNRNHDVSVYDISFEALERMKNVIYPDRYGKWDDRINLLNTDDLIIKYDLVIIGTPPSSHINEAIKCIKNSNANIVHIEKPISLLNDPSLREFNQLRKNSSIKIINGYNYNFSKPILKALDIISNNKLGSPIFINCNVREHWEGIFKAHPWIKNKKDSYLTHFNQGGGALLEHSHGVSYWEYLSGVLNQGKIIKVNASINFVSTNKNRYDDISTMFVKSESGIIGSITQDVITKPYKQNIEIIFESGSIEIINNYRNNLDKVIYCNYNTNKLFEFEIPKKRIDDFLGLVNKTEEIYNGNNLEYELSIEFGLDVMKIIEFAVISNQKKSEQNVVY